MHRTVLTACLLCAPGFLAAQSTQAAPAPRTVTAALGVGNAFGWFGGQAERYLGQGRVSVFAGLGYTPASDPGDPSGVTVAGGVRGYTRGERHRAFLKASVSQIEVELWEDGKRRYGPGLQVGYQYTARRGFTMMASVGVGHAVGQTDAFVPSSAAVLLGLGVGYTWR